MALGASVIAPAVSHATDFTVGALGDAPAAVTDCADATNNDCTLRDAIGAATAAGDRVVFASSLSGSTITLANVSGPLQVQHAIDMVGPGAGNLTVDGAALDNSIMRVQLGYSDTVNVSGLTFENGGKPDADPVGERVHGGAIYSPYGSQSTVVVSDCTFADNQAFSGGAIQSSDPLTVTDSSFTNNYANNSGGAIATYGGPATITGSSFTGGNTAQNNRGGAIHAFGPLTVSTSTISGNHADEDGGGLWALGDPGEQVHVDRTTLTRNTATRGAGAFVQEAGTIANSTFSGNHASSYGGGLYARAYVSPGPLTVTNSTISGNIADLDGGGILAADYEQYTPSTTPQLVVDSSTIAGNSSGGPAAGIGAYSYIYKPNPGTGSNAGPSLTNTIVAANTPGSGAADLAVGAGTDPFNASFSLIQSAPAGSFNSSGPNVVGQDPLLAPLADNGGPTQTRALGARSPAIDAGSTALTTDQRGLTRPFGSAADIGAFEDQTPRSAPIIRTTAPAPAVKPPSVLVGKLHTGRNFVSFRLRCKTDAACKGAATLFTTERLRGKKIVSLTRIHKKKVKVGSKSFSIAAGTTKTIKVKVNARGRKLIAKFHKLPVKLQIALMQSNGKSVVVKTKRATIKPPRKKHHHRKH